MAIENDWTDKILVLDLVNSQGEQFHFEIPPGDTSKTISRPSDTPEKENGKVVTLIIEIPKKSRNENNNSKNKKRPGI